MARLIVITTIIVVVGIALIPVAQEWSGNASALEYIVQAHSSSDAKTAVSEVGGKVTDELTIINAVGATLSAQQVEKLQSIDKSIKVFRDGTLNVAGDVEETFYPSLIGASQLHQQGIFLQF